MSVIVLITINLTLTYQKHKYRPPIWTNMEQQNTNPALVHFIQVPDRQKCPPNQRQDKYGTCRSVVTFS